MSVYPDAIDTYRQPENQPGTDINDAPSTAIFAEHFGDISDAVRRTQQTLGLNPQGAFDTVAEWLAAAALQSEVLPSSGGTLTGDLLISTEDPKITLQDASSSKSFDLQLYEYGVYWRANNGGITAETADYSDFTFNIAGGTNHGKMNLLAPLDMNTRPVNNMADPTNDQDGATKAYVDTAVAGVTVPTPLDWRKYQASVVNGTSRLHILGQVVNTALTTTYTLSPGFADAVPFYVGKSIHVTDLLVYVQTASTGAQCEIAIYDNISGTEPYPNNRLVTTGVFSVATTGMKDQTVSIDLEPNNLYWVVVHATTATNRLRGLSAGAMYPLFGSDITFSTSVYGGLHRSSDTGVLPDPYTGTSNPTTTDMPAVAIAFDP